MTRTYQRTKQFIDRPIQGALIVRAVLFWACTLLTQVLLMVVFALLFSAPNDFYANLANLTWNLKLLAYGSLLVLPLILYDLVKLSHRWVGPVYRLRTALQALGRGDFVAPIRFREGDYWQELAGDFNVISAELTRLRHHSTAAVTTPDAVLANNAESDAG